MVLGPTENSLLIPGTHLLTRMVYIFQCSVCRKEFRFDDPYGPMCTGPSETRDEHTPTLMSLTRKETVKVQA